MAPGARSRGDTAAGVHDLHAPSLMYIDQRRDCRRDRVDVGRRVREELAAASNVAARPATETAR